MIQDLIEPAEMATMLRANHVTGFTNEEQRILVAHLFGCGWLQLSELVHSAVDPLRHKFRAMEDVILKPLGLERDPLLVAAWFPFHLDCEKECLLYAKMLIETRAVFRAG